MRLIEVGFSSLLSQISHLSPIACFYCPPEQ